jgi:hypothetical protein
MVKLLLEVVDDLDSLKKFVEDPSGAAFTSIVTPCGGMVDVIETVSGKSVCGAAGWVELAGGFRVTARAISSVPPPPPPPPPLLEQLVEAIYNADAMNKTDKKFFLINDF